MNTKRRETLYAIACTLLGAGIGAMFALAI
jgi:hypothetical protein